MIRDTESKITDEELFLSSAFQKYQTSLAKAATGRSRYGLQVLMEWDSSENEDARNVGKAFEMFPIAFALSVADMEATYFIEGKE